MESTRELRDETVRRGVDAPAARRAGLAERAAEHRRSDTELDG